MHAASGLVEGVERLVGEVAVADVALGERDAGLEGLVGIPHVVVRLIFVLDLTQNLEGLLGRRRLDHHLLESPLQSSVFLDVLTVLVEGRGTDALYLAARQGGLEDVGSVHRAGRATGADDGVDLIDEEDDVGILGEFVEHGLDALLELSAIFRAGHHAGHVESDDALVEKHARHLALHDAQGEALDYGRLADAGLTDQHGVVLLAAREDLGEALDLGLAPHHGVELALGGGLGHVIAVLVERGGVALAAALAGGHARALALTARRRRQAAVALVVIVVIVFLDRTEVLAHLGHLGEACDVLHRDVEIEIFFLDMLEHARVHGALVV